MRLINTDNLEDVVTKANEQGFDITRYEFKRIELVISEFPTVEAEPVRHGHWDYIEEYFADRWWNTYQCSVCGHQEDFEEPYRMRYCPECGAKMDEVKE